ncbi:pentatricopeptide repeat-containing protein At1g30610, chloroplastic [Impatiens glandulifera]|uniref:pentatricopeptide repeat-containing protein At1g30610, chloroplastic n=1 Tax=Impatiens glandulifera TaxID=253017 RepID=UPI001FB074C3|nr:pentatricopeptide repeat-containing protein At1g30610, chloroplastic [Impatiens glandulifera]
MAKTEMGFSIHRGNDTIITNNFSISSFSFGFSISQRPVFLVALTAKKLKDNHLLGLRTSRTSPVRCMVKSESADRSIDAGVIEKEFEFTPSFGEYLKILESTKTTDKQQQTKETSSLKRIKSKIEVKRKEIVSSNNLPSVREGRSYRLDEESREGFGGESRERVNTERRDKNRTGFGDRGISLTRNEAQVRDKKHLKLGSMVEPEHSSAKFSSRGNDNDRGKMGLDKKIMKPTDKQITSIQRMERNAEQTNKSSQRHPKFDNDFDLVETDTSRKTWKGKVNPGRSDLHKQDRYEEPETGRVAFKFLEENDDILGKGRMPRAETEDRVAKLANCLNGADIDMPEWMFSKMMRSAKIRYTDYSIVRVIQLLGRLGNWRRVLQLMEWLQLCDRFKSHKMRHIYTTALNVLGKARRPVEAFNMFNAMQQQMSTYPDRVAYNSIAVTLGQAGHIKELFEVVDCMRSWPKKKLNTGILEKWDPRLEPDFVVYNAVLNACVQRKQWEGAFWVLQQFKEKGERPTGTTYGLVMEVMYACGKYNLVHDFFRKVLKSGRPNALGYNVLVKTFSKEGKIDEAVSAMEEMESRGVIGSAALYYDFARCLCSAGRVEEALVQVDKICKVATKPLVVTYTGLMQACIEAGHVQNGSYIFEHMSKFCSPNLVTYNIMLKAHLDHGMYEEAKELLEKMLGNAVSIRNRADQRQNVIPDIYSFNIMLDACVADGQWDDFEYIYDQMFHYGNYFNPKRHLKMIMAARQAGKDKPLEMTWHQLVQSGRIPPPVLANEMFCLRLEQGDCVAALSSISSYYSSELSLFSRKSWTSFFDENAHRLQKSTIVDLLRESRILIGGGHDDTRHLALENLIASCKEFLNMQ